MMTKIVNAALKAKAWTFKAKSKTNVIKVWPPCASRTT